MELLSDRFITSYDEQIMILRMVMLSFLFQLLQLMTKYFVAMNWYQEKESDIATAVILSINRYLWYLTEELDSLSLFNKKLSDFTRTMMEKIPFFPPRLQLKVTNDCAERRIKLIIGDFQNQKQNEEHCQFQFQVIEQHRKQNPSYFKSKLINTL